MIKLIESLNSNELQDYMKKINYWYNKILEIKKETINYIKNSVDIDKKDKSIIYTDFVFTYKFHELEEMNVDKKDLESFSTHTWNNFEEFVKQLVPQVNDFDYIIETSGDVFAIGIYFTALNDKVDTESLDKLLITYYNECEEINDYTEDNLSNVVINNNLDIDKFKSKYENDEEAKNFVNWLVKDLKTIYENLDDELMIIINIINEYNDIKASQVSSFNKFIDEEK